MTEGDALSEGTLLQLLEFLKVEAEKARPLIVAGKLWAHSVAQILGHLESKAEVVGHAHEAEQGLARALDGYVLAEDGLTLAIASLKAME